MLFRSPCFSRCLPIENVESYTIKLGFRGGQNVVQLIHNMKWSDKETDKAHKQAFLSSLLLHIYAELFVKGLVPTSLRWSYPSSMGYDLMLQYNQIWQALKHVTPIVDNSGQSVALDVAAIPNLNVKLGSNSFGNVVNSSMDNFASSNPFGSTNPFGNGNPFGGGNPFASKDSFGSGNPFEDNGTSDSKESSRKDDGFDDTNNPFAISTRKQNAAMQKVLVPDRAPFKFEFKDIDISKAKIGRASCRERV